MPLLASLWHLPFSAGLCWWGAEGIGWKAAFSLATGMQSQSLLLREAHQKVFVDYFKISDQDPVQAQSHVCDCTDHYLKRINYK